MSAKERLIFISLMFLITASIFASDSFLPSLPAMTQALHTNHNIARLTITIYLLGFGLSPLIFGPFSDRYGRRPIILVGLAIAIVGSLVCLLANDILWIIIGRFIQASGAAAMMSVARAMTSDIFAGKKLARVGSYLGMSIGLVPALAPTVGGYVQQLFGWRANFILIALVMLSTFSWVLFIVPETLSNKLEKPLSVNHIVKTYIELLGNTQFIIFPILSGLGFAALMSYLAISPFLFQNVMGLTPVEYGWLAVVIGVGIVSGSLFNARLTRFFELKTLLLCAGVGMFIASLLMLILGLAGILNVWAVMLPVFIYVASSRLIFANVFSAGMSHATTVAGFATALFSSIQIGGAAVLSIIAAAVHVNNQMPLAWILLSISILYYLLLIYVVKVIARRKK